MPAHRQSYPTIGGQPPEVLDIVLLKLLSRFLAEKLDGEGPEVRQRSQYVSYLAPVEDFEKTSVRLFCVLAVQM